MIADAVFGWRARAISYRLIAEFCRIQQLLTPLGWSLPRAGAWASGTHERPVDWRLPQIEPIAWEAWLYSAWLRDVRLPFGTMDRDRVEMTRDAALHGTLRERVESLERDATRQHQAGLRLRLISEACLLATLVIAVARYQGVHHASVDAVLAWMARPTAILPAMAIGVLGFCTWSRLKDQAVRATVALRAVHGTRQRIAEIDCAAPLASQALRAELAALGQSLMEATPGWEDLARARTDGLDQLFDPLEDAVKAKAKLPVNGMDEEPAEMPKPPQSNLPLEMQPRHRVPRGKLRMRR